MRGSRPSWIACWVSEKAPVITAWDAMMVAAVASTTMGISAHSGIMRKKGLSMAAGLAMSIAPWPR